MNIAIDLLKTPNEVLTTLCSKHGYPLIKVGNHQLCKVCAKENLEQTNKQHQEELQQKLLHHRIHSSGLNQRYLECGFSNYSVSTTEQQQVVECCQNFTQQLLNGSKSNLILYGTPGTGKTHLGSAIIRNVIYKTKMSSRYITSAQIAKIIMNSWSIEDQSEEQWIQFFADFDLLVLDEYGLHDRHSARLELVHKVLYKRYDMMRPTMIISNFTLENLERDLDVRLWSRLHENQLIMASCYWSDYRMR
ncbi:MULTISPECIES: ATP-binding protein [unclassified Acinetobacter]|uniref:ATP-binding protein n=1 Tax=unclassified Acinetobacter TaxID=196816 RepID=UPI0015D13EC1|nr:MULTISPECIES: ATP-binding protein [unclassified Acinetobacter]UNW06308.1 ATP-binding protein [Acinetobacter variabilis]